MRLNEAELHRISFL